MIHHEGEMQKLDGPPTFLQFPELIEKELDGEENESIQRWSMKPVSVGGFMTFQITPSELRRPHDPFPG
jgi:hypothetical protein